MIHSSRKPSDAQLSKQNKRGRTTGDPFLLTIAKTHLVETIRDMMNDN